MVYFSVKHVHMQSQLKNLYQKYMKENKLKTLIMKSIVTYGVLYL